MRTEVVVGPSRAPINSPPADSSSVSTAASLSLWAFPRADHHPPSVNMQSQSHTHFHLRSDPMLSYDFYSASPALSATPSTQYFGDDQVVSDMFNHSTIAAKDPQSAFPFGNDEQRFSNVESPVTDDFWFPVGDTANQMIGDSRMTTPAFYPTPAPVPSPAWSHSTPSLDAATSSGSSSISCDSPAPSMQSAGRAIPTQAPRFSAGAHRIGKRSDQSVRSVSGQAAASDTAAAAVMPRPSGACSRCKRLKMKCVFSAGVPGCGRCTSGGHECIVEGRKPRTPGLREQLVKKIREKNEAISDLLSQLHCTSATPLSVNPSRLPLTDTEREACGDVLDWIEKRHTSRSDKNCSAFDMADLDDGDDMSDSDADETSSDDSMAVDGLRLVSGTPMEHLKPHMYSLPDSTAPIGFLANCSLKYGNDSAGMGCAVNVDPDSDDDSAHGFGIANDTYFRPSPLADLDLRGIVVERELIPEILASGLISADEGRALFDTFFEKINPFLCILDEAIHTPVAVLKRCPFLFTVVCAVSSRYHTRRPALYKMAMHFAKASAASAFIDGWKCIEMVQAYLIMAAYGVPTRRWEEDRSWFYSGVAFRLAMELDLNRPSRPRPSDERYEREMLNRYRTWMVCCIIDASICLQLGKQPLIREDAIMQNPSRWCTGSTFQHPFDSGLPDIIELQRIMNRFMDATHSLSSGSSHPAHTVSSIVDAFSAELSASATSIHLQNSNPSQNPEDSDSAENLRTGMAIYFLQYCRLIVLVFGLQAELKSGTVDPASSVYLARCIEASSSITKAWTNQLCKTGLMKYAPDFFFIATGFTGAFLIKLLHPRFQNAIGDDQRLHIVSLATSLIQDLSSSGVSVDEQHTPRLYSQFLDGLLSNVTRLWGQTTQPLAGETINAPGNGTPEAIEFLGQTGEGWQHLRAHLPEAPSAHASPYQTYPVAPDMIQHAEQLEDMLHPGITANQFPFSSADNSFSFRDSFSGFGN
ncbi:hypothetical protein EVG20_g8846 [Dentipellis fragilis]|uniref:Zn(2)-C6 fungal-type domain-containing protein n=1 Tax=Dentipellis fragilis TaxID=205917 RepID=A0A4Y9Y2R3_9AGAM|nr:hypothetical protein EVG20_g8846 [Dentipellis fragilis]